MKLVIIDYGSGNLHSAAKAFERAAREAGLSVTIDVTDRLEHIRQADRIVLPGVGAFGDCYDGLNRLEGMIEILDEVVLNKAKPFLGICVGMQLLAQKGFEHGTHEGLGWMNAQVVPLEPRDASFKIPHMGWNELTEVSNHPMTDGLGTGKCDHAYFVHSYHFEFTDGTTPLAVTDHGQTIAAIVGRDNIVGTQFHPEKSQATGLRLISNFLKWAP